jgi:hypothetical protein
MKIKVIRRKTNKKDLKYEFGHHLLGLSMHAFNFLKTVDSLSQWFGVREKILRISTIRLVNNYGYAIISHPSSD